MGIPIQEAPLVDSALVHSALADLAGAMSEARCRQLATSSLETVPPKPPAGRNTALVGAVITVLLILCGLASLGRQDTYSRTVSPSLIPDPPTNAQLAIEALREWRRNNPHDLETGWEYLQRHRNRAPVDLGYQPWPDAYGQPTNNKHR